MSGPLALELRVGRRTRRKLRAVAKAGTTEQRLALRVRVVLYAHEGLGCAETARRLDVSDRMVREWRARFRAAPRLEALEDRPRSGRPTTVPLEVRCELVKLACASPADAGVKFRDVWTHKELAKALRRNTGLRLSVSEVGCILRDEELRPHKVKYWLHSPDPDFAAKCKRICALYHSPPRNATVLCFDEKTCIQALERKRGLQPPAPGREGR